MTLGLVTVAVPLAALRSLALLTLLILVAAALALRLVALALTLSLAARALTLTPLARLLPLALLALALAGRLVLLSLTLDAALALLALLALGLTAWPLPGFRLFLTLRRFLALRLLALPLACRLALRSSAFLSATGLLTRHALPRCQHSSSQKRGRSRCDEKFVFHENDPPDFARAAEPRLWGNDGTAAQFLQFAEEFYGNKPIRLGVLHLGIAPITRADHAISGL